MTTSSPSKPRPLSPHLGIYKPQISSVMSILHRATGVGLAIGLVVLVAWLVFLAGGPDAYAQFTDSLKSTLGQFALFGAFFLLLWYGLNRIVLGTNRSSAFIKFILGFLDFLAAVGIPLLARHFLIARFHDTSDAVFNDAGLVVLIGFTWAFFYHFCCGIRHLLWDAGWFLTIRGMHVTGWITFFTSTALTLGVWLKIESGWVEGILTKMGVHV